MVGERYPLHHRSEAAVGADARSLFALLDDHRRLAGHMKKPSLIMAGATMRVETDALQGQAVGSLIRVTGRVLGVNLMVEEVITERVPPLRKTRTATCASAASTSSRAAAAPLLRSSSTRSTTRTTSRVTANTAGASPPATSPARPRAGSAVSSGASTTTRHVASRTDRMTAPSPRGRPWHRCPSRRRSYCRRSGMSAKHTRT